MDQTERNELVPAEIRGKLHALRRALSTRLTLEGLAWTALALVALVFVTLGLDYFFRLERELRGGIMVLALAGVGVVVWRQLIRPLRVPMDISELAVLVERRFRQLGDRLVSAVDFSRRTDTEAMGLSATMVRRMADEAEKLALPLRFQDVVERRGIFRTWSIAGCALGLLLGFGFWQTDLLGRWFQRNVLFADVSWPQQTYLTVQGGPDFAVLRGDDLEVMVEVDERSAVVPDHLTLHARYAAIGLTEERLDPDRDNPRRFHKIFPAVPEEFRFYVTGGDDSRDARKPHRVLLIDPPGLRKVQFLVRHPSYTRRAQPDRFDGGSGAIGVPIGGEVTVEAEANKDLSAGSLSLDGKVVCQLRHQTVRKGQEVAELPRQFVGTFEVMGENKPATKILRFSLTDTEGHTNRHGAKYMIQVAPDLKPSVALKKSGVGLRISPMALLPLQLQVKDDCGIAAAQMLVRKSSDPKAVESRPVALPSDVGRELDTAFELDLEPMKLNPGTTVYVAAQATDTLPAAHGGPNVAESTALSFNVIKPEELMEDLVRRQKELRLEFIQAMALQESARAKTESAARVFAAGKDDPEGRRLLASSAAVQQSVGAEVAKAADTMDGICEEMKYNRIGTQTEREQIRSGVVKPLKDLGAPIAKITGSLNGTKSVKELKDLTEQAKAIEDVQRDIVRQMAEILQRMAKLENKQELANKLQLIIDWSEQVYKSIKKKQEAEVGNVFDSTTKPATQPGGKKE